MKRSVNILILVILTATAYAQKNNPHIISGNKLYRENKFEEALPEYMKAKEVASNDPVVNYNLGNTYFRNKNFESDGFDLFTFSIQCPHAITCILHHSCFGGTELSLL